MRNIYLTPEKPMSKAKCFVLAILVLIGCQFLPHELPSVQVNSGVKGLNESLQSPSSEHRFQLPENPLLPRAKMADICCPSIDLLGEIFSVFP